jgi:phospholipid/cholesterol/gamma-HCH transport system substrate-binding protein
VISKINAGEGSIGLLINDKKLYDNLAQSAENLDKLMIDLKANPKRYVHFSVFGGGKK